MICHDAHNHLQDDRFGGRQEGLLADCARAGIASMVVNGTCESDWPRVLALARGSGGAGTSPKIIPAFGCHPWRLHERSAGWLDRLRTILDETAGTIGEIGLDRWKPGLSYAGQEEAFLAQFRLAAEKNRPASIHCLQAWGRLLELIRSNPRPSRGFLLHSYGGPPEMIRDFAGLGAYFSFSGHFLHERKWRQREAFKAVPADRLLVESDAPDQLPPPERTPCPLAGTDGRALNHPGNLPAVCAGLAGVLGENPESLAGRLADNFMRLFNPAA